jgi:hypothetical protein
MILNVLTCFDILRVELCIVLTECICVFRMVFGSFSCTALTDWALYWRHNVFPMRYELNCYISFVPSVEAGSNTSTTALRVVGGYVKGTHCLGDHKYGDLALQFGGASNLRQ